MLMPSRVPLPWLNLTHDKLRLVARVLGTAFAVFLLFIELGFWDALLKAPVQLIEKFNGPLIVVSQANYSLVIKEPFPRRCLDEALAVPDVKGAFPVYLEHAAALWKDTEKKSVTQPIRVIAFEPDQKVLKDAGLTKAGIEGLKVPFHILLDSYSKEKSYGKIQTGIDRELTGHAVHVVGLFALGADFANDGNVIMSAETYGRIFGDGKAPERVLEWVDVGVIQVAPGADVGAVYQALRQVLPTDVRVFTKEEFIQREKSYWSGTTPIGFIFRLGLGVGFVVGLVICFQIISTDVAEHLPQFATLKAMGYSDAFLSGVVLREALWLAVLGFVFGFGLSQLAYWRLSREIGLPMELTLKGVLLVFFLTVVMCVASGLLALNKVRKADPAEVFP